jgi:hypothetical protein
MGAEKTRPAFEACPDPPVVFDTDDADIARTIRLVVGERVPAFGNANADAARAACRSVVAAMCRGAAG